MKRFSLVHIPVAAALLAVSACEDSTEDGDLALYLLADDTLNAVEVYNIDLDSLTLADEPLLSIDEIKTYTWSDHSFTITQTALARFESYEGSAVSVYGIPFIVVAGGERIYLGGLWAAYSSYGPSFPTICVLPLTLAIREAWGDADPDMRNDPRIYMELEATGVLRR